MQSDQQVPEVTPVQPNSSSNPSTPNKLLRPHHKKVLVRLATMMGLLLLAGGLTFWMTQWRDQTTRTQANTPPSTSTPMLTTETVLAGRQHIWEMAFLPSSEMLFTERSGALNIFNTTTGQTKQLLAVDDVRVAGEGGLLGMAIDPQFAQNKFVYTCYNTRDDIRIVRWRVNDDLSSARDKKPIVTGMPTNMRGQAGRHSGCRIAFGPDGYLWAGTGDAAQGDTATQPKNLGGKILRVDRDGNAAPGNVGGEYDPRIYSYGHRNVQGLAFFDGEIHGAFGLSVEHGPGVDDEINELKPGNFGWAPPAEGYDESVPMTDLARFPDAIPAIWATGNPTQAPSGAAIIRGNTWEGWNGALAVAFLKAEHMKIFRLDENNHVVKEERILASDYGRLRAVVQGPDGSLYVGTSNGSDDKILKLTPKKQN